MGPAPSLLLLALAICRRLGQASALPLPAGRHARQAGGCCSWDPALAECGNECGTDGSRWCHGSTSNCAACGGAGFIAGGTPVANCAVAAAATATVTPYTAEGTFATGAVGPSYARLEEFAAALTTAPVAEQPRLLAVHSSGGAAGGVVSEGQGYGLLIAGATAAAMNPADPDRPRALELAYGMFLGWRRMCERSAAGDGSCQREEGYQCAGGAAPCLPHWKFDDRLGAAVATGAAPDGDEDAMVGMMLTALATRGDAARPEWWGELAGWAYATCKQFYLSNTADSPTGAHRIVKLGSCWGGWGEHGQNPSYHAPAAYRMCRDYMRALGPELGAPAAEPAQYAAGWDRVVATTYKMFAADQCPGTGLVTNWAKVFESAGGARLTATTGFSGSGTPGAEYGSEAARAVWRVALDYLLYPVEAATAAATFLSPIAAHLAAKESGGQFGELDIDGACLVSSVHASWDWNAFMFGPTFAALVCPAATVPPARQQQVLEAAGARVAASPIADYYSGSWVAIATLTLNGDFARAAALLETTGTADATVPAAADIDAAAGATAPPTTVAATAAPTTATAPPTTVAATAAPTTTTAATAAGGGCCSWDLAQGCQTATADWCGTSASRCAHCSGTWLRNGGAVADAPATGAPARTTPATDAPATDASTAPWATTTSPAAPSPGECVAVWKQCGGENHLGGTACCAGSTCQYGNPWYSQCVPTTR